MQRCLICYVTSYFLTFFQHKHAKKEFTKKLKVKNENVRRSFFCDEILA